MADATNLTDNLKKLEEISQWFENQDDLDVEEGLTKVKEAATLIKNSKARLTAIENEFQQIEREVSDGDTDAEGNQSQSDEAPQQRPTQHAPTRPTTTQQQDDEPINLDDIPF